MSNNLTGAKDWLAQVEAQETKKQDAISEAQATKQEWNQVLQSVHDRSVGIPQQGSNVDAANEPASRKSASWAHEAPSERSNIVHIAEQSAAGNELLENPFETPFDDPTPAPPSLSTSPSTADEEFGDFESASPPPSPNPFPHPRNPFKNPFKNPVYTLIEDQETDALLPGEDTPDRVVLEGEGLIQPLQARYDLPTRQIRRGGKLALRKMNEVKEDVERRAQEAFDASIHYLSYWERKKAQEAYDEQSKKEREKRDRKMEEEEREFKRSEESGGAVGGVVRPVRASRSARLDLEHQAERMNLDTEVERTIIEAIRGWREADAWSEVV